jgi:dihydroflavonol-4-reductase
MKIFITGATGFIGRHLVKKLTQTEHELYCLVRKTSDVRYLNKLGVNLVTGDVTDMDSIVKAMKGCNWVVNLANIYTFWIPKKRLFKETNVDGTRNVMLSSLETGVSKVVHVSTALIFGNTTDRPFNEESAVGPIRISEYARTKYEGELVAWKMYEKQGLPLVMIYPGAVLGPDDNKPSGQYIRNLIHRKMPATVFNNSIITWVHVKDVADAIIKALEKENNIGQKYLIGKQQLSFRQFNQTISQVSGVKLPKFTMPDFLVFINARILTGLASVIKRPPILGLSLDQIKTMKQGFTFDGSKAERELGIIYTPIETAIEEAIASY